jgi:hypothetical protein
MISFSVTVEARRWDLIAIDWSFLFAPKPEAHLSIAALRGSTLPWTSGEPLLLPDNAPVSDCWSAK